MKKKLEKHYADVDIQIKLEDFYAYYIVGCLMKITDKHAIIRVRGEVRDLKRVVIKRI